MRSTGAIILLVVVLLVGFAGCSGCSTYNSLIDQEENVNEAWANVEAQYERRYELIGNLVETVKGAAEFERSTLESVTQARANATSMNLDADDLDDPAKMQAFQQAQSELNSSLGRLLVTVEAYPQLRATEAFRDLQAQLEGTENRISTARTRYNGAVRDYNAAQRRFPANIVAGLTGHDTRTPFEASEGAERAPQVDFGS